MLPPAEVGEWVPLAEYRRLPHRLPVVYVIRHTPSGKEYVGKSVQLRVRMNRHCSALSNYYVHRAIRQYGLDSFEVCVVYQGENTTAREIANISERGSLTPAGYNMTAGGDGGNSVLWTEELRQAARERSTGRKAGPEERERRRAFQAGRGMGWTMTPEITAKGAATRAEQPRLPCLPSTKEKIAKAQAGKLRLKTTGHLNGLYGVSRGRAPRARAVLVWPPEAMMPLTFDCVADAADHLGVCSPQISVWCSKDCKPRSGYSFAYLK